MRTAWSGPRPGPLPHDTALPAHGRQACRTCTRPSRRPATRAAARRGRVHDRAARAAAPLRAQLPRVALGGGPVDDPEGGDVARVLRDGQHRRTRGGRADRGLVKVFEQETIVRVESKANYPLLLTHQQAMPGATRTAAGEPVVAESLSRFETSFNSLFPNVLNALRPIPSSGMRLVPCGRRHSARADVARQASHACFGPPPALHRMGSQLKQPPRAARRKEQRPRHFHLRPRRQRRPRGAGERACQAARRRDRGSCSARCGQDEKVQRGQYVINADQAADADRAPPLSASAARTSQGPGGC